MAVKWMDNFQIYGTGAGAVARMLNGVYASVNGFLAADPDPTAGGLTVFQVNGNVRKVLPAAQTVVGHACRYWLDALSPSAPSYRKFWQVSDVNNVAHCYMRDDPSGNLVVYRADNAGDVQIAITANPVVVANAWKHIESKLVLDPAAGSIEVRVEGVAVINVAGIRTTTDKAGAIATAMNISYDKLNATNGAYMKDLIYWDNTTGFNNNFMGSCSVVRLAPDADVSLNWTTSGGGTGWNLINEVPPDDDTGYIYAPTPAPSPYKCSLQDVPVSVTSVRAVMPIQRSRKTDAGDGNIQMGLVSGASTGLGTDRPITIAYTYWWDIFDSDPNGGIAWTRASLNALNLQLNRTL